ncbi:hypothetical protein OLN12_29525 [Pseudomonas aeruginosa]|uniref:hypothetical protein n=1 Tax=Pseudomonas aeruginosa TaxID=287 RepID=UPI0024987328|nr:hypothetical protein [Pseudomonas aeruginosa]MDI2525238.1 hypothetical protein [Pseudomonas aeruginosa]
MTDAITIQNPRNRDGSTGHVLAKRSVTFTEIRMESTNTHGGGVIPLKGIKDFKELVQFYRDLSAKQAKKFPDRCLKLSEVKGKPLTLKAAINGEG